MATAVRELRQNTIAAKVYCSLCTRTVEAIVGLAVNLFGKRHFAVIPGQKCPRCGASLDAAFVLNNLS